MEFVNVLLNFLLTGKVLPDEPQLEIIISEMHGDWSPHAFNPLGLHMDVHLEVVALPISQIRVTG
jgi:hypothetical protein